jgi:hypothetical protein
VAPRVPTSEKPARPNIRHPPRGLTITHINQNKRDHTKAEEEQVTHPPTHPPTHLRRWPGRQGWAAGGL